MIRPRIPSAAVFLLSLILSGCGPAATEPDLDIQLAAGIHPRVYFACEQSMARLDALFSGNEVINDLQRIGGGVSLAIQDFSMDRAAIVQRLNRAGIPVIAWMALPQDQGYYLNAENAEQAKAWFQDFLHWTDSAKLQWAAVGLDIEPNLNEFAAIRKDGGFKLVLTILGRTISLSRNHLVRKATNDYNDLVGEIHAHGYPVQTYQFPFVADEREVGSTVLDRVAGLVPLAVDTEVLMTYSSFNHNLGSALVANYGAKAGGIAIGSTSEAADSSLNSKFSALNWEQFSNDLITAAHFSKIVGVYSLEGCVHRGFLAKMKNFNWQQPVHIPGSAITATAHFRAMVHRVIWISTYWIYILLGLVALIVLLIWQIRKLRKKPAKPV